MGIFIPSFDTKAEAFDWLTEMVDDSCIDNHRFAYYDDTLAMRLFNQAADEGCCGSCERDVYVAGHLARIGCNYGH